MEPARGVTTLAGATSSPIQASASQTVSIAILGTDAVLAAAPATPVQLAHACLRAGFASVIPASWGDELIAATVLRRLPQFGSAPVIQCSCPIVAHRLLAASGDLRSMLLPLVPPPVAVARYVRTLSRPARVRITYIGMCPGATDDSIDIRMSPDALNAMLAERGIVVAEQPQAFESVIPPDRRRFRSQPGGLPAADLLWTEAGSRSLVELHDEDFVTELAQHLLSGKSVLIDAAARLGCMCSGATGSTTDPRARVVALEPPRSPAPVVEERAPIDLDLPIPAVSRTPIEVVAVSQESLRSSHVLAAPVEVPVVVHATPITPPSHNGEHAPAAPNAPLAPRQPPGFPVTRDHQGRTLPRAYVARRRFTPRSAPVVEAVERPKAPPQTPAEPALIAAPATVSAPVAVLETPREAAPVTPPPAPKAQSRTARNPVAPPQPSSSFSRGQIIVILIAVTAIAVCATTVIGIIVSRSSGAALTP